jgi:hypothetical protein
VCVCVSVCVRVCVCVCVLARVSMSAYNTNLPFVIYMCAHMYEHMCIIERHMHAERQTHTKTADICMVICTCMSVGTSARMRAVYVSVHV